MPFGQLVNRGMDEELSAAPEPSTWVMLSLGFAGLGYAAARRGKKERKAPSEPIERSARIAIQRPPSGGLSCVCAIRGGRIYSGDVATCALSDASKYRSTD